MPSATLIACPDCDLLQHLPVLVPGESAHCPRCGNVVASKRPDSLNRTLALALAAAFAFLVANTVPMLGLMAADEMMRRLDAKILTVEPYPEDQE